MYENAPTTTTGILATFHLSDGSERRVRFQSMSPVRLGSKYVGFFGGRAVHDGTYHNANDNGADLKNYIFAANKRGFFDFDKDAIPFANVLKITKEEFTYEVPLDTRLLCEDRF